MNISAVFVYRQLEDYRNKEMMTESVLIKTLVCRNKWICHVKRMQRNRFPK